MNNYDYTHKIIRIKRDTFCSQNKKVIGQEVLRILRKDKK